jgi:hypothetical protein
MEQSGELANGATQKQLHQMISQVNPNGHGAMQHRLTGD